MVILKALISLAIAGAGIAVLMHVNMLARALQNLYVCQAERQQAKGGWGAYLPMYNPETWKTPFMTFMFKAMVVFLGIWLMIVAYPVVFGAIEFQL